MKISSDAMKEKVNLVLSSVANGSAKRTLRHVEISTFYTLVLSEVNIKFPHNLHSFKVVKMIKINP